MPGFDGEWQLFEILIFPKEILTFWRPRDVSFGVTFHLNVGFDEKHTEILTFSGLPI